MNKAIATLNIYIDHCQRKFKECEAIGDYCGASNSRWELQSYKNAVSIIQANMPKPTKKGKAR